MGFKGQQSLPAIVKQAARDFFLSQNSSRMLGGKVLLQASCTLQMGAKITPTATTAGSNSCAVPSPLFHVFARR